MGIKKPVRLENAKTIFTKFLSRNEDHIYPLKAFEKVEDTSKGKVLVIDDDKTNHFFLKNVSKSDIDQASPVGESLH